jgi:hypothetical protein
MLRHLIHNRLGVFLSAMLAICLLLCALAACGVTTTGSDGTLGGGATNTATPTPAPTQTPAPLPTATDAPFSVTSVDLSVTPTSIAGASCGSSATFTYTATFHIPAHTAGGAIQFAYTLNNGRSQTPSTVTVAADETSKTFTFTSTGALPADHTYPGPAIVMVTSPNTLISPSAQPSGTCS